MTRTTKAEVKHAFDWLCKLAKRTEFDSSKWPEDKQIGTWILDSAPGYGGYVVEEICSPGMGRSRPLGEMRMSPKEFCQFVYRLTRFVDATAQRR